jgi:hypothetical protein
MSTTITAGNATNGLAFSPDSTGQLEIKTGTGSGTTALTLSSGQVATFAGATSVAGNLSFNSGYGSAAVAYGCRAWVKFVGSTGAITASANVSGVVRNSAGNYTITFATAMPDANYAVNVTASNSPGTGQTVGQLAATAPTTTAVAVYCASNGVGSADPAGSGSMFVTIHR